MIQGLEMIQQAPDWPTVWHFKPYAKHFKLLRT